MPSAHQASEASRVGLLEDLASSDLSYSTMATTNKDAEAPFFKAADYGIVGDVFEVLPKFTEAVKKLKGTA